MGTIYVVTEGCYSEYHIDKVFSTKKAAEEYCALQNANSFWKTSEKELYDESCWDYEFRVEEYPLDDVKLDAANLPMKKRYLYTRWKEAEFLNVCGVTYEEKNSVKVTVNEGGPIRVAAILDYDMPEDKVKKIIYDEIARYKATETDAICEDTYEEEQKCQN